MLTQLLERLSAPLRFPSLRFSAFTFFHGLLVCSIFLASASEAQTAHFAGAQTTIASSLSVPVGVTVDRNGNVYIANSGAGQLLKETLSGGIYTQSTIAVGLADPFGVAVDGSGNVYFADFGDDQVFKETPSGSSYSQSVVANSSNGLVEPVGVAVDGSGNVYIADASGTVFKETLSGNSYIQNSVANSSSGLVEPTGVAVDGSGNVYVADYGEDEVFKETPSEGGSYSQSVVANSSNGLLGPYGVAVDGTGNVYIADVSRTQILEEVLSAGSYIQSTVGNGLGTPNDVAVDGSGNVYIADTSNNRVVKDAIAGVNFSSSNIGTATASIPLTFTFDTAGSLGAAPQVLTGGAAGKDFTDDKTGTCTTNGTGYPYGVGDTCTVNVVFTPNFAGTRQGAVVLDDSNGKTMGTAYLYGSGAGPQIAFSPAMQTVIGSGLNGPAGVAVDGSGNLYIADANNNRVLMETLSGGSYAQTVIGSGFITPAAIAVDGSGNLYIANTGHDQVIKETLSSGSYTQTTILSTGLHIPEGIAVDGSGNVYIADTFNDRILKETLSGGIYQESTILNAGLNDPDGVAVDGSGNLYIADTNNNRVLKETLSQGSYVQSTIASGLNQPEDVAVDGSGNVYITDTSNSRVLEITSGGFQTTIGSGLNYPDSVAVDGSGNVYIADYYNNRTLAENVVTPPALSFASTVVGATSSDSPQTITVIDNGTAALSLTPLAGMNPSITAGFVYDNSSTCPQLDGMSGSSAMAPGSYCTVVVSFTPIVSGAITGSLVAADNNLNNANATQTVALSGTATQGASITRLTSSASAITAGQNVTFTATVSSAAGTPTGTVTFYNGSVSIGTGTLNAGGVATFSTTALAAGADPSFTASYAGNGSFFSSTSAPIMVEVSATPTPTPGFTLASMTATLSVKQGQTISTKLTLTPAGGYNGTVSFICLGLPANAACVFSPASANLTGNNQAVSVSLTIDTNLKQARIGTATRPGQSPQRPIVPALAFWFPGSMVGLAAFGRKRKLAKAGQRWLQICLLIAATGALAVGLSGCGVSHQTPAGSGTVTVLATGTSNGAVTRKTVLLTVTITS